MSAQLSQRATEIALDGFGGQAEIGRDMGVGPAEGDVCEDVGFSRGEYGPQGLDVC